MKDGYVRGMTQNRQIPNPNGDPDRQIGSLIDRLMEQDSVVDRLMDIPPPLSESESPEWDAAVIRRLEARLADMMREIIEPEIEKKSA